MSAKKPCAVPGCVNMLWSGNSTGVCREHTHAAGYCGCTRCTGAERPKYRVKTRQDMVAEGLQAGRSPDVIDRPSTARKSPTLVPAPWEGEREN